MSLRVPRAAVGGRGRKEGTLRKISGDSTISERLEGYAERGMCPIHEELPVHDFHHSQMSSFRNHRVIIASLFLPNTVVVGESEPVTPDPQVDANAPVSIPAVAQRLAKEATKPLKSALSNKSALQAPHNSHSRSSSATGTILSIVEDLKDKSRQPSIAQDKQERPNIFTKLARFAEETPTPKPERSGTASYPDAHGGIIDSLASAPRKHQTTHSEEKGTPRIQRRKSRSMSMSRRRHSSVSSPTVEDPSDRFTGNWHFESNPTCNGGLRNAVESVSERLRKKLWVGTLGTPTDNFKEDLRNQIDDRLRSRRDSVPVWIPDAEFQSAYDEFCHQVLWPALHYAIPDAPKTKMFYESATYKQYVAVNQRFAETIASVYQEGDVIFVNDYHLMLLPLMLRKLLPSSAAIGFFLHVAFPTSEIFRCLAMRNELLLGILGADFVGFQTANYARHFRQTVSRILAFEALPKGIQLPEDKKVDSGDNTPGGSSRVRDGLGEGGRFVDVASVPMGIDVVQLKERKEDPEVDEWVQVLRQRYAGMKLLVGRDKLDDIQGVRHKIAAFESFLDKHPEWQGKVVLIQVALQTTESNELAGGVADVVSRINSRFSTLTYQPVVFLHTQDLTFSQYLALLTVGDAFIVTSLREGMALRTHEYIECQENSYGALILSEFTGSYSYSGFRSCIAINPWDYRGTSAAITKALTMSKEEAQSRWEDLHNHVTTQTAQSFITTFLNRTLRSHASHLASLSSAGDPDSVPVFNLARMLPRYKHSMKRLILVDFEGTLWRRDLSKDGMQNRMLRKEEEWSEDDEAWPRDIVDILKALAEDKKNEVWVLSGLARTGILGKLAKVAPKVGIIAENGCFIKTRATRGQDGQWLSMVSQFNMAWKSACLEILQYFTERTPDSFIEEREASLVWRFWSGDSEADENNTDRQWARRQAAEAQNHIFDSLGERFGLRIIPGKNSFLVLPNNISRSAAVAAVMHPGGPARSPFAGRAAWMSPDTDDYGFARLHSVSGGAGGDYISGGSSGLMGGDGGVEETDFMLAISSDERLLRRLNENDGAETVSTSGKATDARWRIGYDEVKGVLTALAATQQ